MNTIIRVLFEDKDVVISREELRRSGIRPGEYITISPAPLALSTEISSSERMKRIESVLRALWGAWSEDDEKRFRRKREEMWSTWQFHN